ncbi:MAG: PQQ-dependent dehydrogenase, methanol/ethanol family [Pseudomonadales bacterium]
MSFRMFAIALVLLGFAACSKEPAPDAAAAAATETAAASTPAAANVNAARIIGAAGDTANWLTTGRTYDEQRYSPEDQINASNVKDLGLAWSWETRTRRGLEATPLVIDGVMYTSGAWSVVWAHNARTGELLWSFDPQVPRDWGKYACCDVVNRGVAAWAGKIFVGTIDGRLIALDAATGKPVWDVLTIDKDRPYTITGAPRVVKGKVIIGNGGAEYGVRGYIAAYDASTGNQAWRFYTVPGDPGQDPENKALEMAAGTWRGTDWWTVGGGGTVWDSMAYDPELNLLYIGVGNGSPWNRYIRSPGGGDNLFLSSIVAVNPDDGSYVWHYQTTPGDSWDYTAVQHMILADLEINGATRKVIMQAPKNGFFYVLDRTNGQFISAEAYVPVTWATHVDPESGRPVENPEAHYANETKKIRPAPYGGHNWHPMTFNPNTGLVYIPVLDLPFKYGQDNAFKYRPGEWNTGVDFLETIPSKDPDTMINDLKDVKGYLAAWDPVAQKEVWRVQHAMSWNGGLLSTAGNLVFQGRADGKFAAYTADKGELVWEVPVDVGIVAAPITYTIDGEQYIAVVAGWGGAYALASGVPRHKGNVLEEGRILVFKLGGKAEMPKTDVVFLDIPKPPEMDSTPEQVAHGEALFHTFCSVCHGGGALSSGGGVPDLKFMSPETHATFDGIVLGGARAAKGMPKFDHVLSADDAKDLHAFLVTAANNTIAFCQSEYRKNYPELLDTACTRSSVKASE